jgi:hypothetical protein
MLLADSFASWGYVKPIEASLEDLQRVADEYDLCVVIHKFTKIMPGQTLQQHVRSKFESGECPGPWLKVNNAEHVLLNHVRPNIMLSTHRIPVNF